MRRKHWLALGGLVATLVAGLGLSGAARSQLPPAPVVDPLPVELARVTDVDDADVRKLLTALGPVITRQLSAGRQVELPGLGTFRVVRLGETRNLLDGRVVVQPARNIVEFLPSAGLDDAANAPGALPEAVVPAFQYVPLPGQTPGQKVPYNKVPPVRVR